MIVYKDLREKAMNEVFIANNINEVQCLLSSLKSARSKIEVAHSWAMEPVYINMASSQPGVKRSTQ